MNETSELSLSAKRKAKQVKETLGSEKAKLTPDSSEDINLRYYEHHALDASGKWQHETTEINPMLLHLKVA